MDPIGSVGRDGFIGPLGSLVGVVVQWRDKRVVESGDRGRPESAGQHFRVADVLDGDAKAVTEGESIDLVGPLAGELHVDDGDDSV